MKAVCDLQTAKGAIVGACVWRKLLQAKCQHHMLYREFKEYALLFQEDSLEARLLCALLHCFVFCWLLHTWLAQRQPRQVQKLLSVQERNDVEQLVDMEVEARLTGLLRALPSSQVSKATSDARFLVRQFQGLLQVDNQQQLSEAVEGMQKLVRQLRSHVDKEAASAESETEVAGPVAAFFGKHTAGVALLHEAQNRVEASKQSLANEMLLKDLRSQLQAVQGSALTPQALLDLHAPWVQKHASLAKQKDIAAAQKLEAQSLEAEFWSCTQGKLQQELQNLLTGVLEVFNETWSLRGQAPASDSHTHASTLSEAFKILRSPLLLESSFWKQCCGSRLCHEVQATRDRFASTSAETAACAHHAFWIKRGSFPFDMPMSASAASTDALNSWLTNLCDCMREFVDDVRQLDLFNQNFTEAARETLASLTLSSFENIGALVKQILKGQDKLEALRAAKIELPSSGIWVDLLEAFCKAGPALQGWLSLAQS